MRHGWHGFSNCMQASGMGRNMAEYEWQQREMAICLVRKDQVLMNMIIFQPQVDDGFSKVLVFVFLFSPATCLVMAPLLTVGMLRSKGEAPWWRRSAAWLLDKLVLKLGSYGWLRFFPRNPQPWARACDVAFLSEHSAKI